MRTVPLLVAVALLALAGCAPTPLGGDTGAPAEAPPPAVTPAAPAPGATAPTTVQPPVAPAPIPDPAPPAAHPTGTGANTAAPLAPSLACRSDADCAVKDVGSCCGYRPACVSADAETFPEQVKARCAAEGRMGICGFQPIAGCQCVSGQCSARPDSLGPEPPKALQ